MNLAEVVREYFPDATDDQVDMVIWMRTGFPGFWKPKEKETPIDVFRRQIQEYKEALEKYPGQRLCDFCNEPSLPGEEECQSCKDRLQRAKGAR